MREPVLAESPEWIGQPVGLIIARSRQRALELAHNCIIRMKSTQEPIATTPFFTGRTRFCTTNLGIWLIVR